MKILALAAVAALGLAPSLVQQSTSRGISWYVEETRTFPGSAGQVRARILSIDLRGATLRILSVPFEAGKTPGSTELSIRGLAEILAKQRAYQGKDWLLVNGGFSSYSVDVPLGLLVVDGKVYSNLAREAPKAPTRNSEYAQYRWSGILCLSEADSRWSVLAAVRYKPGMCREGLQSGPVPVEPGPRVGIAESETRESPFIRTVLCIVSDVSMKVAVTENETHLYPMAVWMTRPESAGGLGCQSALNLSGDSSSGIAISSSKDKALRFVGTGAFPLPSALLFQSK